MLSFFSFGTVMARENWFKESILMVKKEWYFSLVQYQWKRHYSTVQCWGIKQIFYLQLFILNTCSFGGKKRLASLIHCVNVLNSGILWMCYYFHFKRIDWCWNTDLYWMLLNLEVYGWRLSERIDWIVIELRTYQLRGTFSQQNCHLVWADALWYSEQKQAVDFENKHPDHGSLSLKIKYQAKLWDFNIKMTWVLPRNLNERIHCHKEWVH